MANCYRKEIEITNTGMVIASVYSGNGRHVGCEFFSKSWLSAESKFKKAHEWADKHIALCHKYETQEL